MTPEQRQGPDKELRCGWSKVVGTRRSEIDVQDQRVLESDDPGSIRCVSRWGLISWEREVDKWL